MPETRAVPSWPRLKVTADGDVIGPSGGVLKPRPDKDGYYRINHVAQGKHNVLKVHTLVCEAFHGHRPEGLEACHGNGVRTDNRAGNLRWGTRSDNMRDRESHERGWRGTGHPINKLTEAQAIQVRRRYKALEPVGQLATEFGVHRDTVRRIGTGELWRYLP